LFLARRPPLAEYLTPQHLRDLGNLLLAFVMLWAYMSFSQFLLIWSGDVVEEIPWYLRRTRGGWQWLAMVLIVFNFVLPFILLLMRDFKERAWALATVAVGILVLRFLDIFWWIEPAFVREGNLAYWYWLLDVAALVGLGGVWGATFIGQLKKWPLLPARDP